MSRDADTVAPIQGLDGSDPFKQAPLADDSRLSINRHQGNAPGGNQFGKLRFLQRVYGRLVERLSLPENHPDKTSRDAFKYASYDVLQFVDRGAQRKVKDAGGNVLSVMGNGTDTAYMAEIRKACYGTDPATGEPDLAAKDPARFASPNSAAERAALDSHFLSGADLWFERTVYNKIFMSDALVQAMTEAKLADAWQLKRCRVVGEPA